VNGTYSTDERYDRGVTTYGEYLKIDGLLKLQDPRSEPEEHDEMLFIIIHQVYELWFKQILHELDRLVAHLHGDELARGGHQLRRVRHIFKTMVGQIDILETMTPLEFLSFRRFLDESSGFQSVQFRELECLLGITDTFDPEWFKGDIGEYNRLIKRIEEPTLWDAFVGFLHRNGHPMPESATSRDPKAALEPDPAVQAVIANAYRNDVRLLSLCEALTDLDEALQEWRYRHVMMVQRTIGTRMGTGGSSGVDYLKGTLFRQCFPDLWAVRSQF
jgi:tryptophan 2,3-dioxygenase